jgi:hypothetical protein
MLVGYNLRFLYGIPFHAARGTVSETVVFLDSIIHSSGTPRGSDEFSDTSMWPHATLLMCLCHCLTAGVLEPIMIHPHCIRT